MIDRVTRLYVTTWEGRKAAWITGQSDKFFRKLYVAWKRRVVDLEVMYGFRSEFNELLRRFQEFLDEIEMAGKEAHKEPSTQEEKKLEKNSNSASGKKTPFVGSKYEERLHFLKANSIKYEMRLSTEMGLDVHLLSIRIDKTFRILTEAVRDNKITFKSYSMLVERNIAFFEEIEQFLKNKTFILKHLQGTPKN